MSDWAEMAGQLTAMLRLDVPPMAITFSKDRPHGVEAYDEPIPAPTPDGRTGRVPAGCVFWMKGTERTFTTVAEDHGNCSVGSLTHGLIDLAEAAGRADVAALVEAGWVTPEIFPEIPVVADRPNFITYGPLAETTVDPDVVFLRVDAKQLMTISDAVPGLRVEGKPQCHIVPLAVAGEIAASVGCALSRVRTGMKPHEMTCAIPAAKAAGIVDALRATVAADATVATYAAEDKRRFG